MDKLLNLTIDNIINALTFTEYEHNNIISKKKF